jgi:excisionase family DNA binding protein
VRRVVSRWLGAATQKTGEVVNVHTAEEVAAILKVEYKTVLRLIQAGRLKSLPGIRHKRITEAELNRYLGVEDTLAFARTAPRPSTEARSQPRTNRCIPNGDGCGDAARIPQSQ